MYDASAFSSVTGTMRITQIAFRPDADFGGAFSIAVGSVTDPIVIHLSTTAASPGALDDTFADNVGGDEVTVYNGALTLSSSFTGPVSGPKDFDILIVLQTPFFYNPSNGNLLLDLTIDPDFATTGVGLYMNATNDALMSRTVGSSTDTEAGVNDSTALVTQFTFDVPEPASLTLLGAGGLLLLRRRRMA